jgi:uncharacterized membrane protein
MPLKDARPLPRLPIVDLARGLAIAQMIAYHFIYDLTYFGWLHIDMTREAEWIGWRNAIVTQFLLVCGVGVALGDAAGRSGARFWRRWVQVAAAAALVSISSAWMFGPRLIWFGILHFIAVALLLARPLPALGLWNLAIGAALLALGLSVHDPRPGLAGSAWLPTSRPPRITCRCCPGSASSRSASARPSCGVGVDSRCRRRGSGSTRRPRGPCAGWGAGR